MSAGQTANGDQAANWARIDRAARRAGAHRGDSPAQKMTAMFMGATNPESEWGTPPTTDQDTLKDIERSDPDGTFSTQPTAADYREHKNWAVKKAWQAGVERLQEGWLGTPA